MRVVLELGGGLELLFDNVKRMELDVPISGAEASAPAASTPATATATDSGAGSSSAGSGAGASSDEGAAPSYPAVDGPLTIRKFIAWVRDNLLKERPELFVDGDSIRPGVLCLINDADWELEGKLDYEIQEGDNIVFISTLHGG